MTAFDVIDVIRTKRDGGTLTDAQIDWVIDAYTAGQVAEEQMSALLMAILLNGMTGAEIAAWTTAMIASGRRMDLSAVGRPTVDKHSTGGVGDKISLPLVPLVAIRTIEAFSGHRIRTVLPSARSHVSCANVLPDLTCSRNLAPPVARTVKLT